MENLHCLPKEKLKIHVIGAGISGLIASKVLEENGYHPTLIESSKDVGGLSLIHI